MGLFSQGHAPAALPPENDPVHIVYEAGWAPGASLDECRIFRLPTGVLYVTIY
jgi:hypothetical protein